MRTRTTLTTGLTLGAVVLALAASTPQVATAGDGPWGPPGGAAVSAAAVSATAPPVAPGDPTAAQAASPGQSPAPRTSARLVSDHTASLRAVVGAVSPRQADAVAARRPAATVGAPGTPGAFARPTRPGPALRHPAAVDHPIDMAGTDLSTGRAIVLRVRHTPDPQEPHSVSLERTKVYVRRADTGPIEVTALRRDGTVIDRWRAPDPLTTSAEQARDDEARYGVPYSPELAVVEITDTRTGAGTAARIDEVVRGFCASSPADEVCRRVDLVTQTSLDVQGPYVLTVGEPLAVPVHVRLENLGPDRADASAGMFVFGILDGIELTTADPVSFAAPGLEPGVDERTVTYALTCTQPGDVRVFIGARAYDDAPEAVEATPADNESNTWFDVHCEPAV